MRRDIVKRCEPLPVLPNTGIGIPPHLWQFSKLHRKEYFTGIHKKEYSNEQLKP